MRRPSVLPAEQVRCPTDLIPRLAARPGDHPGSSSQGALACTSSGRPSGRPVRQAQETPGDARKRKRVRERDLKSGKAKTQQKRPKHKRPLVLVSSPSRPFPPPSPNRNHDRAIETRGAAPVGSGRRRLDGRRARERPGVSPRHVSPHPASLSNVTKPNPRGRPVSRRCPGRRRAPAAPAAAAAAAAVG